jgi:uncharacterized damage-inducible protein DinB
MGANGEHDRFLTLFQRMVDHTDAWIAKTPPEKLDWVPIQTSAMRFGDRVSRVTIKGLVAHIVVGEAHWAHFLLDCEDGATMLPPSYSALAEEFEKGDFQALAHTTQARNMYAFAALSAAQLAKHVVWARRRWTVMGFLWGAYAHRAFHIGNMDIYLRQADVIAPEFFEFNPAIMA